VFAGLTELLCLAQYQLRLSTTSRTHTGQPRHGCHLADNSSTIPDNERDIANPRLPVCQSVSRIIRKLIDDISRSKAHDKCRDEEARIVLGENWDVHLPFEGHELVRIASATPDQ